MKFAVLASAAFAFATLGVGCNDRPATAPPDSPTAAPTVPATVAYTLSTTTAPPSTPPTAAATGTAGAGARNAKVRIIELTQEGDLPSLIRAANVRAKEEHRTLVVYVGADWCPPCKMFHEAVLRGDFDEKFPNLTVMMVDLDANKERVLAAGYGSKFIPFFAVPGPDGHKAKGFEVSTLKKDQAMAEIIAGIQKFM